MDDDVPPPLSSIPGQVQALSGPSSAMSPANLPTAVATVIDAPAGQPRKAAGTIRRGFFDVKPSKPKPAQGNPVNQNHISKQDGMLSIKASKARAPMGAKPIPDFMMLEPSEQQKQYEAHKKQMLEKLKPTSDMVAKVAADPVLGQGFDDPEVMAAVNDIAANPSHIKKYKNNKKVQLFYEAMGKVMGQRLEELGGGSTEGSGDGSDTASKAVQKPPTIHNQRPAAVTAPQEAETSAAAAAAALLAEQRPTESADIRPLVTRCCIEEVD